MRRRILLMILLLVLVAPVGWTAEVAQTGDSENLLERIDGLLEKATAENYRTSGLDLLKESLDLCLACMEEKPTDYEILWRCSRAAHQYAETARNLVAEDWETTCKEWGKRGMEIAEKAQGIEPGSSGGVFLARRLHRGLLGWDGSDDRREGRFLQEIEDRHPGRPMNWTRVTTTTIRSLPTPCSTLRSPSR